MLFCRFISASWVIGRWLALAAVLSLAAPADARAQAPAGANVLIGAASAGYSPATHIVINDAPYRGPSPIYYVDGRRLDPLALGTINPNDMESVNILKNAEAFKLGSDEGRLGVILIVTKAGQHTRAVRAFNRRLERLSRRQP